MRFSVPVVPILAAVLAAGALPSAALARPALVKAVPAADAAVTRPTTLTLTFSEELAPVSGIDLVMTAMPGMADHKPMPIKGFTAKTSGKVLTVALPRPLPVGTYRLSWHAVGNAADQDRAEGSYSFKVH